MQAIGLHGVRLHNADIAAALTAAQSNRTCVGKVVLVWQVILDLLEEFALRFSNIIIRCSDGSVSDGNIFFFFLQSKKLELKLLPATSRSSSSLFFVMIRVY